MQSVMPSQAMIVSSPANCPLDKDGHVADCHLQRAIVLQLPSLVIVRINQEVGQYLTGSTRLWIAGFCVQVDSICTLADLPLLICKHSIAGPRTSSAECRVTRYSREGLFPQELPAR